MKYDQNLLELKNLIPVSKNILIALPSGADVDQLAAGLSLFLLFEQQGKQVSIVCEDTIRVDQAHLFGIDHVQKNLPQNPGGNLTLTMEGVAASDGTVPALEKLDWYAENNNLNLVFHVLPGQTFQPARIVPHFQGSSYNLIFVIGADNLNRLGSVYDQKAFSGVHVVNIDSQTQNTGFGQTNVVDPNASSLSEIVSFIIGDLGYSLDQDMGSNLLAGIFAVTQNLTSGKAGPDTYLAVANCMKAGGQKPQEQSFAPSGQGLDLSSFTPKPSEPKFVPQPIVSSQTIEPQPNETFTTPPVVMPQAQPVQTNDQNPPQPSAEERPAGEGVMSAETIEPEWLTPKIFKGTSLG